jgi:maltose/moltooligosaccharide transporter
MTVRFLWLSSGNLNSYTGTQLKKHDKMKKPILSFWQIWNMSFGFLDIRFGFALQNANVSRISQTLGSSVDNIPILWVAARMLWIMDASINISTEPFRAFVGDMLPDEQRTKGFNMQSFFMGTGAVIASALAWILTAVFSVSNKPEGEKQADSVTFSFYVGAAVFLLAVAWTVFSTREYPPEQLANFENSDKNNKKERSSSGQEYPGKINYLKNSIICGYIAPLQ